MTRSRKHRVERSNPIKARASKAAAVFVSLLLPLSASAQTTDNKPVEKPATSYLEVSASAPTADRNNIMTSILLQVKSATGQAIPVAVDSNRSGWSGFGSGGETCRESSFYLPDWPRLYKGQLQDDRQPDDNTAGVKRAALVPIQIQCNVKKGEELSFSAKFYVLVGNVWKPQQFSWQRLVVK
jgi:hypothetical protein